MSDRAWLNERWRSQARYCAGASPLYERIALAAADDQEVGALLLAAPETQRLGIIVFAAVHYLLLRGSPHPLAAFYPSIGGSMDGDPYPAFRDFALSHADEIRGLVATRAVQTNEVNRCTYLLPALAVAAPDRPVAIVEIGASAGLNLLFDRYRYEYGLETLGGASSPVSLVTEVRGPLHPRLPSRFPAVTARVGIDPSPVDPHDPDAVLWLRACIWPEQTRRAERFAAAIELARRDPPAIIRGTAAERLEEAVAGLPDGALTVVMHTATLPYFTHEQEAALRTVLVGLSRGRDIAWIAGEGDRILGRTMGMRVSAETYAVALARLRGGAVEDARVLAAAGYHGEWLRWSDEATARGAEVPV